MKVPRVLRKLSRRRRLRASSSFSPARDELSRLTASFCEADTLGVRTRRARQLFSSMLGVAGDRVFLARLLRWIRMMQQDAALRHCFQKNWDAMLAELDSVPLFADVGLPGHHTFPAEVMRRLFQRLLPSAREERDTGKAIAGIFSTSTAVERFEGLQDLVLERLKGVLWTSEDAESLKRVHGDMRQAMRLLAARAAGRVASAAMRQRSSSRSVADSPFYRLVFVTERLLTAQADAEARDGVGRADEATQAHLAEWCETVEECRAELEQIHLHMEDAGVSSALVYDLRSIEATLGRMQLLVAVSVADGSAEQRAGTLDASGVALPRRPAAARLLVHALVRGPLDDMRLRFLFGQNLNLLARKMVERTGHGGEHYIAHSRRDYWQMWRAAAGGGLLTVFTAALKMRLIESHFPLAVEGFLIGTDYAVSFVLLQIFGLALATKQPSMTAATLAGIVRENRGVARWSKISEFAADISRTQLAAALSNVMAVCVGAVVFERLWTYLFKSHYLPVESAQHVYTTLHPFTSGTAVFAAFTGVLLWLAAIIGGWCENFAVYHRIPEAIAQHPAGMQIGLKRMRLAADWLERNTASWSTSIVLGYLLGFAPVVARFFGIPLDVRHVTLSTGTLALAAARFGTSSFGHGWLYSAAAGIGITFVLNLGVSFSIASIVALRAYDVPRSEQWQILKFLAREFFSSPMTFLAPPPSETDSVAPARVEVEEVATEL